MRGRVDRKIGSWTGFWYECQSFMAVAKIGLYGLKLSLFILTQVQWKHFGRPQTLYDSNLIPEFSFCTFDDKHN